MDVDVDETSEQSSKVASACDEVLTEESQGSNPKVYFDPIVTDVAIENVVVQELDKEMGKEEVKEANRQDWRGLL